MAYEAQDAIGVALFPVTLKDAQLENYEGFASKYKTIEVKFQDHKKNAWDSLDNFSDLYMKTIVGIIGIFFSGWFEEQRKCRYGLLVVLMVLLHFVFMVWNAQGRLGVGKHFANVKGLRDRINDLEKDVRGLNDSLPSGIQQTNDPQQSEVQLCIDPQESWIEDLKEKTVRLLKEIKDLKDQMMSFVRDYTVQFIFYGFLYGLMGACVMTASGSLFCGGGTNF